MTRLIASSLVGAVAISLSAAQMPKYGVTANVEKDVDLSKLKTYSWTQGQPSAAKSIDAQIVAAIDHELGESGMTKAASGPGDVLIAYYSLTRTDVDVHGDADEKGMRPQYSVGTLVVAMLEPSDRRRLVRLRIDKPIDTAPAQLDASIKSAVAELFEKYRVLQSRALKKS